MPRFSIVIPVYNNVAYLPGCLNSLLSQTLKDWEAIVVIDGSPDDAVGVARGYAGKDPRFVVIDKAINEGAHLARKTGVEKAKGDHVLFLDGDDELASDALQLISDVLPAEKNVILHFGLTCVGDAVARARAKGFEGWANTDSGSLSRDELLKSVFSSSAEHSKDWNVCHRVYGAEFAKHAFESMLNLRLERAEDAYELLVLAALSDGEVTRDEIKGYLYHIGRGVTNDQSLSLGRFASEARELMMCADAAERFANLEGSDSCKAAAAALRERLVSSAANEWYERVGEAEKLKAIEVFAEVAGRELVATELMRFARDAAYAAYSKGEPYSNGANYQVWFACAERLALGGNGRLPKDYSYYCKAASDHIGGLKANSFKLKMKSYDAQDVRIFVSAHKEVDTFDSNSLQPVQVGCSAKSILFPWAWHDNDGENISSQNPMYCELTAQYWAWKNVDAEYYGFCHYRRYFNFSTTRYEENEWGEIIEPLIDQSSQRKYGLDDETIRKAVEGYDVVTTEVKDLSKFPGDAATPLAQYEAAPKLNTEDLYHVFAIVEDMYPDYIDDIGAFANGHKSCFCNMFIMKKQIFMDYCEWLFPILRRFVSEWDSSLCSKEGLRTPGHLAERLLNIYLLHGERVGTGWKRKEVQCVHFEFPDKRAYSLPPVSGYATLTKPIIPVVFAADNNYAPMLTTTILSMLENASDNYYYDIVVIEDGISGSNKQLMQQSFAGFKNAALRFFGAGALVGSYELTTSNEHISKETYYRFLIQDILPYYDKVLYLDSDLIIEGDVAELFATGLGSNLVAAAHDVDYMGNLNMPDGKRAEYTKEILKMSDPYSYFQAGVLVLNTSEMRALHSVAEWLDIASNPDYIYNDQDILNANCEGRVVYLGYEWNVMHDCGGRVNNVFSFAPAKAFDAYNASRANPKVIHYAGFEKPWIVPECDFAERYWKYARKTPFYEKLIALVSQHRVDLLARRLEEESRPAKAIGEDNPIRKVVDPLMPLGSRRREIAKTVGRTLRGRS